MHAYMHAYMHAHMHAYTQVGARLRAPSLSAAFVFWVGEYERQAAERQLAAREAESRSLEGQLKQATFEMGQVSRWGESVGE